MTVGAAYLAPEGLETVLEQDLARRGVTGVSWHGRLALAESGPVATPWALDIWTAPQEIPAPSVKAAADALRAIQRNWAAYPVAHFRRMALIGERLPPVKARPLVFPAPAPAAPLGAWTLLAPDRMLVSATKSSPFVNGEAGFVEDRVGPPSRAYLKLWEACTRLGRWPGPGARCFDLGACPGGWTWAIATLGAGVVAVDKAPLEERVAALPGVSLRQESAFGLEPEEADWMFSDIIAYPARLLALVRRWIDSGRVRNIVCTLKFQGETDFATADAFAAIPGGQVMHLFHNKHELTFAWSRGAGAEAKIGLNAKEA
jgi:23S rRNA (cytidine2498-2'-O)-methyltransferase